MTDLEIYTAIKDTKGLYLKIDTNNNNVRIICHDISCSICPLYGHIKENRR